MLAIALVVEGENRSDVARQCGMDRQTLGDWVHRYNAEGSAGLSDRAHGGGARSRLSAEHQAEVAAWVRAGPDLEKDGVVRWRQVDLRGKIGLALPEINVEAMNLYLAEIGRNVAPGAHAVVVLDGAGRLCAPGNLSLLHLPPYSPELNPAENIWQYLRQNYLSNRAFDTYDAILDACCAAWNALMARPQCIRSIAQRDWVTTVNA
jgi:hypothetical protein